MGSKVCADFLQEIRRDFLQEIRRSGAIEVNPEKDLALAAGSSYKRQMIVDANPQAYTRRILSNLQGRDPWDVLSSTAGRLRELTAGRTRDDLARKPDPTRWSVVQILAHLADAEIVGAWRFRLILASDGVALQPFDQNAWAETFRYQDADALESIELFEANRTATMSLLRRVDPALHANHGMHAERGKETVEHLVRLYAGHDLNHLAQIQQLLGT
jgi:hypothetical protein